MSPQHQRWGGERGPGPPRPAGARPRDPAAGGHFQPLFWKRLPAFCPKIMLNFTPWCPSGPTFGVCTGRCPRCRAVWVLLGPAAAAAGAHRPGCACPAFLEGLLFKTHGSFRSPSPPAPSLLTKWSPFTASVKYLCGLLPHNPQNSHFESFFSLRGVHYKHQNVQAGN